MRVCRRSSTPFTVLFLSLAITLLAPTGAFGQGAFEAQIRGTVTDQSGAMTNVLNVEGNDAFWTNAFFENLASTSNLGDRLRLPQELGTQALTTTLPFFVTPSGGVYFSRLGVTFGGADDLRGAFGLLVASLLLDSSGRGVAAALRRAKRKQTDDEKKGGQKKDDEKKGDEKKGDEKKEDKKEDKNLAEGTCGKLSGKFDGPTGDPNSASGKDAAHIVFDYEPDNDKCPCPFKKNIQLTKVTVPGKTNKDKFRPNGFDHDVPFSDWYIDSNNLAAGVPTTIRSDDPSPPPAGSFGMKPGDTWRQDNEFCVVCFEKEPFENLGKPEQKFIPTKGKIVACIKWSVQWTLTKDGKWDFNGGSVDATKLDKPPPQPKPEHQEKPSGDLEKCFEPYIKK